MELEGMVRLPFRGMHSTPAAAPEDFSARSRESSPRPRGFKHWPPQRTGRNTPYGIVWLNRFHRRMDTKMDTKRKVGRADSQAGFGVRFGVHFSTKRGRFGGFQRL